MLLQLGLQGQDDEYLAGRGALETAQVSMSKVLQGVAFYTRGLQLMGQDVQLFGYYYYYYLLFIIIIMMGQDVQLFGSMLF